jgi:hypothetical protein
MTKTIVNLLLSGLLIFSFTAHSREFDDRQFPDNVTLSGTDTRLQLNGIGMRTKFVFDVYIGALYTERSAKTRDDVQAQTGPKRILMHFVYDEVSAEKLVAGWNDGFEENQTEEKLKALHESIEKFNAMFTTVHEGDVVLLDYIPGKGTVVNIKGVEKGVVEGEDFNKALLDIWLGEEPADDDLKEAMLGEE